MDAAWPAPAPPAVPALRDPFPDAEPARLTGPFERQRFHPVLAAFLVGAVGWIAFQLIGLLATVVFLSDELGALGLGGLDEAALAALMAEHIEAVFGANAIGQVVGLGMLTLLATRLHTPDVLPYLRIRHADPAQLALGVVGLAALLPFVSWLGELNGLIPMPDALRAWDEQQAALLEPLLAGGIPIVLGLLFVALAPALCEEVLFRGLIQRNVERRLGVAWAIVLSGVVFGLFHLRFGEALPLSMLGVFMAFGVWVTGSLWTGVLLHFLNNGAAIVVSSLMADGEGVPLEEVAVPWYLALGALAVALGAAHLMLRRRAALLGAAPAGSPHPTPTEPPRGAGG